MAWTQDIESVVHMAALWGWKLDPDEAEQANVQAPLSLWQQAWTWPRMTQFVMPIGYMSQHQPHMKALGLDLALRPAVAEVDWSRVAAKTGVYEASKLRSYWLMREEALRMGCPVSFIHPATVLGDMASPEVPESSAVAQLLSQLAQGKSPLVPGGRHHRVPLVSAGYVSAYVVALLARPSTESVTEHLLLDSRTPDLLTTMRTLAQAQGVRSPYGRVPLPWVRCLAKVGPLARTMGLEPESLPFIIEGTFDVNKEDAQAALWGVDHPDLNHLLRRTGEAWRAAQKGA
jgi:nucleoside-diphosphate-sugar epimerase